MPQTPTHSFITNKNGGVTKQQHRLERITKLTGRLVALFILGALVLRPAVTFAAGPQTNRLILAPAQSPTIQGEFLHTFQKYGLSLIGYPLSDELNEGGTTVQYFERVKMEYHPELAAKGTPVLFTRLGSDISAGSPFAPVAASASTRQKWYFGQTHHTVAEPFLSFWRNRGGVALFGYPISQVVQQDGMSVQWFERARMEYHPELAAKGTPVQLTLLGRIAYSRNHGSMIQPVSVLPKPVPAATLSSMESDLLANINEQRAAAGLPAVSVDQHLSDFARSRSSDMSTRNYFAHVTPEGKASMDMLREAGVNYKLAGEILAMNNAQDDQAADMALNTYLQSPPHKAIMLDGRYTHAGVGYAKNKDGMHYFTVIFTKY